jgi:hypothetical protein
MGSKKSSRFARSAPRMALACMLAGAASACSTCDRDEFLARVRKEEAIMSNWQPGEFDLVDQERALLKRMRAEAEASGDYGAACRAIDAFKDQHTIRGHH